MFWYTLKNALRYKHRRQLVNYPEPNMIVLTCENAKSPHIIFMCIEIGEIFHKASFELVAKLMDE